MATYGPFLTNFSIGNPVTQTVSRISFRQKPVTKSPLPYWVSKYIALTAGTTPSSSSDDVHSASRAKALYLADQRFRAEVREASSALAANFAERKQAYDSLTNRTLQLFSFTLHILARDFKGAARVLGMKKRPGGLRELSGDLGGIWLEYSFGWKPLIADIYSAVDVLQQPFVPPVCRGRATVKHSKYSVLAMPPYFSYQWYDRVYKAEVQADVQITNWPVWKANQLGIINPASVAWEVVPFSFVLDWIIPVGEFLQSLTDYVGLSVTNAYYTQYGTFVRTDLSYTGRKNIVKGVTVDRILGLPSTLGILKPRFTGFYSARGANAIALLASALSGCSSRR